MSCSIWNLQSLKAASLCQVTLSPGMSTVGFVPETSKGLLSCLRHGTCRDHSESLSLRNICRTATLPTSREPVPLPSIPNQLSRRKDQKLHLIFPKEDIRTDWGCLPCPNFPLVPMVGYVIQFSSGWRSCTERSECHRLISRRKTRIWLN